VEDYNALWKQKVNMGRRNNQNFVAVPFGKLRAQIKYKAELAGIIVVEVPESYTSKCSFLDNEPISHHEVYLGRRIKRGLFKVHDGRIINADINGTYNILRQAFPEAIMADGIEGLGLVPYSVMPTDLKALHNLSSTQEVVSKAVEADGIEAPGQRQGESSDLAKNRGKDRTEQSLLNFVNKI